ARARGRRGGSGDGRRGLRPRHDPAHGQGHRLAAVPRRAAPRRLAREDGDAAGASRAGPACHRSRGGGDLVARMAAPRFHGGVDRTAAILPWGAGEGVPRVSPVEASARILRHLREGWDASFPDPLAAQEMVLTVPASFDEVARELTLAAAREAGFPDVVLL